jgi:hypothetical protein
MRNWPLNGLSWDAMSTREHAIADAKSPRAIAAARRLPLCTNAIATSVSAPTRITPIHFTQLTLDSLKMMRWRRASSAFCRDATISRCAVFWPSVRGSRASASRSARSSATRTTASVASPVDIAGHSWLTALRRADEREPGVESRAAQERYGSEARRTAMRSPRDRPRVAPCRNRSTPVPPRIRRASRRADPTEAVARATRRPERGVMEAMGSKARRSAQLSRLAALLLPSCDPLRLCARRFRIDS